jgi:hypothetical protein
MNSMAVIRLEIPGELEERLERECSMLGFEEPSAYLRWLVDNRAALQGDDEQNRILAAYAERIEELEERLEVAEDAAAPDRGDPATAASEDGADPETFEANLAPATARISDDSVGEVANELKRAQGEVVDEMARQAVAKTRRRLGEGSSSGLSYSSRTALRSDGPRPGSDVTDLDELEVPGYEDELVERRREAVGAALALLKDVDEAKRSDFVSELYETYPAGYSSSDGWWECIKRGLRQVDRVDDAGDGSRIWRFRDFKGRVRVLDD